MPETQALWRELICRLDGVYAAQVVFSEAGEPLEIHVLARDTKSSKALVRDVQSALAAQFGVQVDHRIISIAQVNSALSPKAPAQALRLVHTGLEVRNMSGHVDVCVTLMKGDTVYTGSAGGASTPFARRRSAALAALEAVNQAAGQHCFELASSDLVTLDGQDILIAQVYSLRDGQRLLGAAFAQEDMDTAAVHSVLSAVNRRLAVLTGVAG